MLRDPDSNSVRSNATLFPDFRISSFVFRISLLCFLYLLYFLYLLCFLCLPDYLPRPSILCYFETVLPLVRPLALRPLPKGSSVGLSPPQACPEPCPRAETKGSGQPTKTA